MAERPVTRGAVHPRPAGLARSLHPPASISNLPTGQCGMPTPNIHQTLSNSGLSPGDLALLASRMQALPALPTAVSQLLALLAKDSASPAEVEAIVKVDAALTAKTLALANSARFGLRRQVSAVAQATSLLGTRRLRDLLMCASLARAMPATLAGYGMDARAAWLHNAGTAVLSEELARRVAPALSADAFTAGLLHDVGKLAIGALVERHWPELASAIQDRGLTFAEAERATLGIGHSEVGELVLERWALPRAFPAVARWHHEPAGAPEELRSLVGLVHVASSLAHTFGFGADQAGLCRSTQDSVRAALGLTRSVVEASVADALPRVQELAESMS